MSTQKQVSSLPVVKSTEGLRDALFDEINMIRQGNGNPQRARAIALMAARVIDSIRVQIQYGKMLNDQKKQGEKEFLLGSKK